MMARTPSWRGCLHLPGGATRERFLPKCQRILRLLRRREIFVNFIAICGQCISMPTPLRRLRARSRQRDKTIRNVRASVPRGGQLILIAFDMQHAMIFDVIIRIVDDEVEYHSAV